MEITGTISFDVTPVNYIIVEAAPTADRNNPDYHTVWNPPQQNPRAFDITVPTDEPHIVIFYGSANGVSKDSVLSSFLQKSPELRSNVFDTIAALRSYNSLPLITPLKYATTLGYYTKGDGAGGDFVWNPVSTATDNGGTIIQPTGIATGRWFRMLDGESINVKIFGATGDGVTNDSVFVQNAIDAFATGNVGGGASFLFPAGTYRLANISIPRGTTLYANQQAKDNVIAHVPVVIRPVVGQTKIFVFEADSKNSSIQNLYIDGDWQNNLNLVSAIEFAGSFNALVGNNINACAQYGVYSTAGACYIQDNNIQGWFGPPPTFTGLNDFRGALHIIATGDSYIIDNEIGAAAPYLAGQVPTPIQILRDPINRRIVAMAAITYMGNSVVTGNIFENGDRAVAILNSLYWYSSGNRYEMCGGGGLYITGLMSYANFIGERFANNSLAEDGGFDDIQIGPGGIGPLTFVSPIFEIITNAAIPTSNFKVRYNITNYSPAVNLITPQFDPNYYDLGPINMVDPSYLPMSRVEGQHDYLNPVYESVTLENLTGGPLVPFIKISKGGNATTSGSITFWDADTTLRASIGNSPGADTYFTQFKNGIWVFLNGDIYLQKNGAATHTVWSIDSGGPAQYKLISNNLGTQVATFTLDNTSGDLAITCTGAIILGASGNFKLLANGLSYILTAPTPATRANASTLGRNNATGEIVVLSDPTPSLAEVMAGGKNATPSELIITNLTDALNTKGLHIRYNPTEEKSYFVSFGTDTTQGTIITLDLHNLEFFTQTGFRLLGLNDTQGAALAGANFNSRVKGEDALNANEFVTKAQLDAVGVSIYTANGTLSSDRTVTMNAFGLSFLSNNDTTHFEFTQNSTGWLTALSVYPGSTAISQEDKAGNLNANIIIEPANIILSSVTTSTAIGMRMTITKDNISFYRLNSSTPINIINTDGRISGTAGTANNDFVVKSQIPKGGVVTVTITSPGSFSFPHGMGVKPSSVVFTNADTNRILDNFQLYWNQATTDTTNIVITSTSASGSVSGQISWIAIP